MAMLQYKLKCVMWVDCQQHVRVIANVNRAGDGDGDKPHNHYRAEEGCNAGGAAPPVPLRETRKADSYRCRRRPPRRCRESKRIDCAEIRHQRWSRPIADRSLIFPWS